MENQAPVIRVCGWITVISCAIFIVIELMNLVILCRKKKLLKSNVVYLIITVLGFLDFGQQVIHLFSGIWCVTYWVPPFRLNMFLGSFVDFLYNLSIINGLILSINRFFIFFKFSNTMKKIIQGIFGVFIIGFCILIILFFILHQFYYLRVYYEIDLATWNFVSTEENNYAHNYFENRLMTSINLASLFIFSLAMLKLFLQKCFNPSFSRNVQKYEYYIFIKAGLNFFCIFATQFLWEFGPYFWPEYKYLYTILNTLWVLTTGRDCCMNIIFLSEVRNDIIKFFTRGKITSKILFHHKYNNINISFISNIKKSKREKVSFLNRCFCLAIISVIFIIILLKLTTIIYSISKKNSNNVKNDTEPNDIFNEKPRSSYNDDSQSPICSVYFEDHLSMIGDDDIPKKRNKRSHSLWAFDTVIEGIRVTETSNDSQHMEYIKKIQNQLNMYNKDFEKALERDSENRKRLRSYNFYNQYLLPLDTPMRCHSDSEIFEVSRLEQSF
ncbi:Hypothetical protein SRAE_2000423900 [Strongyloides ratti]|uniref:7TM GPCR, serpentine receptor class x (Srx) family-containing protein n=1 Tax=Strongyloides ratti TaxID=34506 RepID=A0A090LPW2_STRRB|nr:Hypothetical protein SRAE_2000423900 [Strongyloides ratti]CEF69591.1 Hypothetical protein SRAE_2000423900 [Strongyloides ratti]